ncbi:MAG: M23 family metallopeptidase [Deltaproteobacteria bacterium]|nr:M23 family metallopeptidase [Deltaproteobacteria bacterium]
MQARASIAGTRGLGFGIGPVIAGIGLLFAMGCAERKPPAHPDATPPSDAEPADAGVVSLAATGPRYGIQQFLKLSVTGSIEATITSSVGPELGPALSQVAARALVWWLNPSKDLQPKDKLELVYELKDAEEPIVHAIWFESKKLGKSFGAVRYKAEKSSFERFYQADGAELEQTLVDGPIEDYEQVTSLLRDGRGHKGVDFKAPVGSRVVAPFAGKVVRKNWSVRANGDCVDVLTDQGINAIFLHLNEVAKGIEIGGRVVKGQEIGKSGNTGHSTAPHLHYQIERQKKVLDPFDVHQTATRHLPKEEQPGLTRAFERFMRFRNAEPS